MKKTVTLLLVILLCICSQLAFSEGNREKEAAEKGKITLKLSRWDWSEATMSVYEKYIGMYKNDNPGVEVEFDHTTPYGQYRDEMLKNIMSGQASDIFVTYDEMLGPFVNMGACKELDSFIANTPGFKENFYESQWALGTVKDKQYGIPFRNGPQVLYYNKTMFKDAGLPQSMIDNGPQTLEEFITASKACTIDKDGDNNPDQFGFTAYWADFAGVQTFRTFLLASGGHLLNEDGSPTFNDKKGVEVLEFLMALEQEYNVVPTGSEQKEKMMARNEFTSGIISMVTDGSWLMGLMGQSGVDFGITEIFNITGGDKQGTGGGYVLHSMSTQTKHPDEAWKLLEILSSEDFIHEFCKAGSLVATRKDTVANNSYWNEGYNPMFVKALARPNSRSLPPHPKISELMKLLRVGIQTTALEKGTPKAVLDDTARTWENIR